MSKFAALGSKKQAILLAVLAVVLVLAVVRWRPGGGPSAAAASSKSTSVAARQGAPGGQSASAADDSSPSPSATRPPRGRGREVQVDEVPVLSEKDFQVPPSRDGLDVGRDLFGVPREPTRKPPPTPYPPPPPPGDARFVGPLPPPGPTPTPKPPEITFKFVGTFGPKGHPIAVIQEGDKVYNVRAGDILFDKFVLRNVGYESLDIGFVGYPEAESRRIGITPN